MITPLPIWTEINVGVSANSRYPEDAAAKPAIELFKRGTLVEEGGEVRG
jgi:hypothetical protein